MSTLKNQQSPEQRRLARNMMFLSGGVMLALSVAGFIFIDQLETLLGDRTTAYLVAGMLGFVALVDIIMAKIVIKDVDRV